jgi:hypothetical protein
MKPVPVEIAHSVLSRHIDDLKPTLTRYGYDVCTLAEQFNAKRLDQDVPGLHAARRPTSCRQPLRV